jgi:23S rRNA (uracil1939-C5)-methyltransferase
VRVRKRRGARIDGDGVELLAPGPDRVAPRCAHAGRCGGCSFQQVAYPAQLEAKRALVREALAEAGLGEACEVEAVLGCAEPWAYRNKMEYSFGSRRWVEADEPEGVDASFGLGLHPPGFFSKVVDLTECPILFPGGEAILRSAGELARAQGLPPWDVREHTGLLRHLVLRHGVHTDQVMVNLVTSAEDPERIGPYAAALLERHPEITTLVQTVNSGAASVAYGERELVLHGPGFIEEELLGVRFRISARSFFQTNTRQAERLFELVREEAAPTAEEVVHDLYSGAGTIALVLAPAVREVVAFEQVPEAVADAHRNAERNGATNLRLLEGDVLELLDGVLGAEPTLPRPDVCVVDPPRAGLHPKVPPKLLELAPRRIVMVSCNVHNGARDAAQLVAGGYRLTRVRPVDLFPHTPHVEVVLTLEREASAGGAP